MFISYITLTLKEWNEDILCRIEYSVVSCNLIIIPLEHRFMVLDLMVINVESHVSNRFLHSVVETFLSFKSLVNNKGYLWEQNHFVIVFFITCDGAYLYIYCVSIKSNANYHEIMYLYHNFTFISNDFSFYIFTLSNLWIRLNMLPWDLIMYKNINVFLLHLVP